MDPDELRVTVAYSPAARQLDLVEICLPVDATVGMALARSGVLDRHPALDLAQCKVGVWGKLRGLTELLRDGDRVEVYRALQVDPKEARRQRYRSHRDKAASSKR
jgi:uncharacterized protein